MHKVDFCHKPGEPVRVAVDGADVAEAVSGIEIISKAGDLPKVSITLGMIEVRASVAAGDVACLVSIDSSGHETRKRVARIEYADGSVWQAP